MPNSSRGQQEAEMEEMEDEEIVKQEEQQPEGEQ